MTTKMEDSSMDTQAKSIEAVSANLTGEGMTTSETKLLRDVLKPGETVQAAVADRPPVLGDMGPPRARKGIRSWLVLTDQRMFWLLYDRFDFEGGARRAKHQAELGPALNKIQHIEISSGPAFSRVNVVLTDGRALTSRTLTPTLDAQVFEETAEGLGLETSLTVPAHVGAHAELPGLNEACFAGFITFEQYREIHEDLLRQAGWSGAGQIPPELGPGFKDQWFWLEPRGALQQLVSTFRRFKARRKAAGLTREAEARRGRQQQ